jgi:glycosyltransferase involved in cell wall biosynthesis
MERHEIHIVRTHMYHANMYGRIAAILAGVPVKITSSHDLYISPDKPKIHRRLINCILGMFSDAVVAVSQSVASDILKYDKVSRGKVKIIYNGIAIDKFADTLSRIEAREFFNLPVNGVVIGSVGRLTDQKGHRYLIEAAAGLENVSIALAGDGPERERLQELARQCRVNCIMPGRLEPEQVRTFLGALDIFCFPSLWEGFGTALVEAMASGLPVIASDIPPHREVLGDAGELVAPGNSKVLSGALRRFTDAPSLMERFGEKVKSRSARFSIEATVSAYEKLFEDILKRKGML